MTDGRASQRKESRSRSLCGILLVAILTTLFGTVTVVHGQDEGDLGVLGIPANTTAVPIENGFINLATGNMHLEFPLGSWPQRGGREYKASLMYDTASVADQSDSIPGYIGGGWRLSNSAQGGNIEVLDYQYFYCDYPYEDDAYRMDSRYAVQTEADGTSHTFKIDVRNYYPAGCNSLIESEYDVVDHGGYALDTSGYHLHISDTWDFTLRKPDGSIGTKDSNGNSYDTLARTLLTSSTNGNYIYYDVLDSRGSTRRFTVTTRTINISYSPSTLTVIDSIGSPDGTSYSFTYDEGTGSAPAHYGRITSMTLPTGGTISYSYPTSYPTPYDNAPTSRTTSSGTWSYIGQSIQGCTGSQPAKSKITVTKPSGDNTVYTFTKYGGNWPTQIDYYNGSVSSSNLLASVTQTFSGAIGNGGTCPSGPSNPVYDKHIVKTSATTTLPVPGGSSVNQTVQYSWEEGSYLDTVPYHTRITQIREWKFYTGSLQGNGDRITDFTYLGGSSYLAKNIIDRKAVITVTDGGGNVVAKTINCYDNDTSNGCSGSSPSPISNIANHDDTNYSYTNTVRGNLTQVKRLVSGTSTYVTKSMTYDATGQMLTETDWNGNTTTYSYADNFFDDSGNTSNPVPHGQPSPATNAYPTSISQGGLTTTYGYYWGTGQKALVEDPNDQTTYFHFYDPFNRPTLTKLPNGGWTLTEYTGATQVDVATGITSTTPSMSCSASEDDCRHDRTTLDTFGRVSRQTLISDPGGATHVDTTYDSNRRVSTVSNPHRDGSSATDGITAFRYDGLDRQIGVVRPDGKSASQAYGAAVGGLGGTTQQGSALTGIGYPTLAVDEAGKARQSWFDGFGRLVEVDEPAASSSASTFGTGNQTVNGTEGYSPNGGTSGTGSVTISGSIGGGNYWDDCKTEDSHGECVGGWVYEVDSGDITLRVNNIPKSVYFSTSQDTATSLANSLRNAINADSNYPVSAGGSGTTITLTAKQVGLGTNYSLSITVSSDYGNSFTGTSASGPYLTGGQTFYQYDAGTVWITVNGVQTSTTYGQGSTASSVASSLTSAINANTSSPVTASVSGAVITLTATTTGVNHTVSSSGASYYPAVFPSPSFSVSTANLSGGGNTTGLTSPLVTLYTYDLNGNLTCVEQHGGVTGTGCSSAPSNDATSAWRVRRFGYDMISRLLSAKNPESGTTTYTYDDNGNVLTKTDARNITTTYTYNTRSQLLTKSYNDGTTPTATFAYDACPGSCPSGVSPQNASGRLVKASTSSAQTFYSYDAVGGNAAQWQCTPLTCGTPTYMQFTYTHTLMGGPLTLSYNGGFTISQTYDGTARVKQVTNSSSDQYNPATLVSISAFAPIGGPTQIVFGNTLEETRYYNNRQQVTQMRVYDPPSTDVLNLQFTWATAQVPNNGNLAAFSASGTGTPTFSRSYGYDALNRLGTMSSPADPNGCTGLSWTYDAWGNRPDQTTTGGSCTGLHPTFAQGNNRMDSYSYDAAGNLLGDGTHTYAYDAENRIKSVDSGATTYTYDANGNRVQKTTGSSQVHYFYGEGGEVLVEKNQSGTVLKEYIYAAGQRMERSGGKTYFIHTDHLGSARTVSDYTGCVVDKLDYYPFGELIPYTPTCTTTDTTHKFTGKERDSESGLDNFGARYNPSWMGRFMSVDPEGLGSSRQDPQSWNMYAYAANNPLKFVDPDGLSYRVCIKGTDEDEEEHCTVYKNDSDFYRDARDSGASFDSGNKGNIYVDGESIGTFAHFGNGNSDTIGASDDPIIFPLAFGLATSAAKSAFRTGVALVEDVLGVGGRSAARAAGDAASTPVGRLGSPMNVAPGTNTGTTIGGRFYSGHALDSMQSRGLVPSVIEHTIARGVQSPGTTAGTIRYATDQAVVILNRAGNVVTTYPK